MDNLILSDVKIVKNLDALSDSQKAQFYEVITDGLKGKFESTLHDNTESMLKLVKIWGELRIIPLEDTFSAIDANTGDVLSIILMNDFKPTSDFTDESRN